MNIRHSAGLVFLVILLGMVLYVVLSSTAFVEGFTGQRCGVDLPSCQGERVRCINGYCKSDVAPRLPFFSDLPLLT